MVFARVAKTEWRPKRQLKDPLFEEILDAMSGNMKVLSHARQQAKRPGFFRVKVTINVGTDLVDLFHNACTGYRAQFYGNAANGERANRYAIEILGPKILASIQNMGLKRDLPVFLP